MTRPKNTSPPNGPSVRYVLGFWFLSTETSAWTSRTSLPVFRLLGAFTVITLFAQIASSVRATHFSAALLNGPVPSCLVFWRFFFIFLLLLFTRFFICVLRPGNPQIPGPPDRKPPAGRPLQAAGNDHWVDIGVAGISAAVRAVVGS